MIEIVSSFTSIHDIVESLAGNYQVPFETAAEILLQEKKTRTKENKPMRVLKFVRDLKYTDPEYKKFTRDEFNRKMTEWGCTDLIITDEKTSCDTSAIMLGESGIELTPQMPSLTEWDDESEALGVCILCALANPSLASKAQKLTAHWFPTQVQIEGLEHADFVELSKKYGFDGEKAKGFSCVTRGAILYIKRQQGKEKIEYPEEFASLIKKPSQPKETQENRARRRLKRFREIVEKEGEWGTVAKLVREEQAAGRTASDRKSVERDLERAKEAEKRA